MNLVTQLSDSFTIKHVSIINPARKMALQGVEYSTHVNEQGRQVDAEPKPYQQPYFAESRQRIIFEFVSMFFYYLLTSIASVPSFYYKTDL